MRVSLLLVVLVATSIPALGQDNSDLLREHFLTNKSTYDYGEPILAVYQYYNASGDTESFTVPEFCDPFPKLVGHVNWGVCYLSFKTFTLSAKTGVEYVYKIDPALQAFPYEDSPTHTILIDGWEERGTMTFEAPRYLGGVIEVEVADDADPNEVDAIRDALNAEDIDLSVSFYEGPFWQIEGTQIGEAQALYGDNPVFDRFRPIVPFPDYEIRPLIEVEDDVVLSASIDGGVLGGGSFLEDTPIDISIALTNHTESALGLSYPGGLEATYEILTTGTNPQVISGIECYCLGVTTSHERTVAAGQRVAWPEEDESLQCFTFVPEECGVGPGTYTLQAYAVNYYDPISIPFTVLPVLADEPGTTPFSASLSAAPNPFSASTTISLTLSATHDVEAVAYDVLGRRVAILHEGTLAAGTHPLTFEATRLPAGVYVVRVLGGGLALTQRVTLAR
ncbi:MAG: T9SS type A sorting domain-containing protein [Bacteroidota bacterium]